MKLSVSPPPYEGAPVVVLIAGLGGSGSYWLPQLAALEPGIRWCAMTSGGRVITAIPCRKAIAWRKWRTTGCGAEAGRLPATAWSVMRWAR